MNEELKKEIMEGLKASGLEVAEDAAISSMKAMFKLLPIIVLKTENKMDDMLIPILGVIEKPVMELLDKIDGIES